MKTAFSKIQCKNVFKDENNIRKTFSLIWADIINQSMPSNPGLANADDSVYNKEVQSYPRLDEKGVE